MSKLTDILKIETQEIAMSFAKASIEGEGTPQEVSDRREEIIHKFLKKFFPFPFRVVKGNIIDSYGNRSNSIDCIVINPSHPYTVDAENGKPSIIFADGVDYAIEVKPDLSNNNEIERGLKQVQSVKKLIRVKEVLKTSEYSQERAKSIPTFIFAEKTYTEIRTLLSNITDYYVANQVPRREQFDMIIVNNKAIIFNVGRKMKLQLGDFEGLLYTETGENTLAVFLLYMNMIPKSEPEISENILKIYLNKEPINNFQKYYCEDLNKKLNALDSL